MGLGWVENGGKVSAGSLKSSSNFLRLSCSLASPSGGCPPTYLPISVAGFVRAGWAVSPLEGTCLISPCWGERTSRTPDWGHLSSISWFDVEVACHFFLGLVLPSRSFSGHSQIMKSCLMTFITLIASYLELNHQVHYNDQNSQL